MQSDPTSPSATSFDAIVIGGGVSGLAIANALARTGRRVKVLERAERIGGSVHSAVRDGFLCEAGPNSMLVKSEAVWNYLHDLGMDPHLVEANAVANKRFLVKRGRMEALPQSPLSAVSTPLYSPLEKMRLLAEPFIGRSTLHDESVTSFVSRRMGPAFLEYGISALVSGIFAGDPDALSIKHAFPKVWNLEQQHGSLIGGALKLKRQRKKEGIVPFKSRMISFRQGLGQLVERLAAETGMEVTPGCPIESIEQIGRGRWRVNAGGHSLETAQMILATPLSAYGQLPFLNSLKADLAILPPIPHPPLSTLVLGFDRSQVSHPLDGFGVLCPRMEKRFSLGCIFSSTLFPGRAPEGKVSLMCFIGGVQQPENGQLPTSQLVEETVRDLAPLLGLTGDPCFHSHTFWPLAIPQYNVGHGDFLAALEALEARYPGLHLRGNFRGGPGLNDCLENGLRFAEAASDTV